MNLIRAVTDLVLSRVDGLRKNIYRSDPFQVAKFTH